MTKNKKGRGVTKTRNERIHQASDTDNSQLKASLGFPALFPALLTGAGKADGMGWARCRGHSWHRDTVRAGLRQKWQGRLRGLSKASPGHPQSRLGSLGGPVFWCPSGADRQWPGTCWGPYGAAQVWPAVTCWGRLQSGPPPHGMAGHGLCTGNPAHPQAASLTGPPPSLLPLAPDPLPVTPLSMSPWPPLLPSCFHPGTPTSPASLPLGSWTTSENICATVQRAATQTSDPRPPGGPPGPRLTYPAAPHPLH